MISHDQLWRCFQRLAGHFYKLFDTYEIIHSTHKCAAEVHRKAMSKKTIELEEIESITLDHYNQNAEAFWNGTKDHDVAQNYEAFLSPFPQDKKLDILDLGCGPGRDVHYFKSLGHRPVGLDGSAVFCSMARNYTDCQILCQKFLSLQ